MTTPLQKAGEYCGAGLSVIWLQPKSKKPMQDEWASLQPYTLAELHELHKPNCNISIRPGRFSMVGDRYLTIIDFDIKDTSKSEEALAALTELFPCWKDLPRIASGSRNGSMHLWLLTDEHLNKQLLLRSPGKINIDGKPKDCWQIELYGNGAQTVVPPSIHPDSGKQYIWEANEPDWLFGEWPDAAYVNVADLPSVRRNTRDTLDLSDLDDDDRVFEEFANTVFALPDVGEEEAREILTLYGNEDLDYDTWQRVIAAIAHQFYRSEVGLRLAKEWSALSDKDVPKDTAYKYKSFRRADGDAATFKWLIQETGWNKLKRQEESKSAFNEVLDMLQAAESVEDIEEALTHASKFDDALLPVTKRDVLVTEAKDAYRRIDELAPGKPAIAKLAKYKQPTMDQVVESMKEKYEGKELPEWLQKRVYVESIRKIIKVGSHHVVEREAFNAAFNRHAIEYGTTDRGTALVSAFDLAMEVFQIPVVYQTMYYPGQKPVFQYDGIRCVNTYIPPAVKLEPWEGHRAVTLLRQHIDHLFVDQMHKDMVLDFIAHLVQHPGQKLQYAVLLVGVRGDGKSLLIRLMEAVLGVRNVGIVKSDQLNSNFNAWSENCCLLAIEEVKQHGMDAYDTLNRMKDVITNKRITVEGKGVDSKSVRSFASVFMTSNYRDAMPIDDGENRYQVLFTRFGSEDDCEAHRAKFREEHGYDIQDELFDLIDEDKGAKGAGALRSFFKEYTFSEHYNPTRRAKRTEFNDVMTRLAKNDEEVCLDEAIADESEPRVTGAFVFNKALADYMNANYPEVFSESNIRRRKNLLIRRGYTNNFSIKIGGAAQKFWGKDILFSKGDLTEHGKQMLRKAWESATATPFDEAAD